MKTPTLQLSSREFVGMARDVDDMHHDSMRSFKDESAHELFGLGSARDTRRGLFKKAGLGAAVVTFGSQIIPVKSLMPVAFAQEELTDVDIGVFAESVELAAVAAYQAAVDTGLLSEAAIEVGTMFAGHHQEHAAAFAGLVGDAATGEPNAAALEVFGPMIAEAADEAALLGIALELEEGAAATYHFGLGLIQDPTVAAAPATILPIESAHAVVLAQVLGNDPATYLPSFQNSDAALSPADFPVGGGSGGGEEDGDAMEEDGDAMEEDGSEEEDG